MKIRKRFSRSSPGRVYLSRPTIALFQEFLSSFLSYSRKRVSILLILMVGKYDLDSGVPGKEERKGWAFGGLNNLL